MIKLEFVENFKPQAKWDGSKYFGILEKVLAPKSSKAEGDYDFWFGVRLTKEFENTDDYLAVRGGWNGTNEVYLNKKDFVDFIECETIVITEHFTPAKCSIPGEKDKLAYPVYAKNNHNHNEFTSTIFENLPENISDYVQIKGIATCHVVYVLKKDASDLISYLQETDFIHTFSEEEAEVVKAAIACG